jgi:hypothetical protein
VVLFANNGWSLKGETWGINEGIAVGARLVKSATRPVSKDELKELEEKRKIPEGNVDKNGNALKFSRPPARRAYAPERMRDLTGR